MGFEEKLFAFAHLVEHDKINAIKTRNLDCDSNILGCKVVVIKKKKYANIDVGGSGAYMVDISTETIYGIKAYGTPNKLYNFGTLETILWYNWGEYRGAKLKEQREPIESLESVVDFLNNRGLYIGSDGRIYGGKYGDEKPSEIPVKIVFGKDRYSDLSNDLKEAARLGSEAADLVQDSGTCNLDAIYLRLPGFNEQKTIESIHQAGLLGNKRNHGLYGTGYHIDPPSKGQAYKREKCADIMYKYLRDIGYDVSNWCQMD